MNTVQFQGENNWEAIVNHNSLNIVEEDEFRTYILDTGCESPRGLPLRELEQLYNDWELSCQ